MIHISPRTRGSNPTLITQAWRINKPLTALVLFCVFLIAMSAVGLLLDPRATALIGTPAWSKTFKFSISVAFYASGLLWIIQFAQGRMRQIANVASSFIGLNLIFELILIVIQGARAQPMHFNESSPFDVLLWRTMTVGIMSMLVSYLVLVVTTWRGLKAQPVLAWGVRLGLVVTALGLMQGFTMSRPTTEQLKVLESGQNVPMLGAHTVGSSSLIADAGPGLPLLGWSTTHGDLRIGHFVGLHALQIIPLLALFLVGRPERWLTQSHRIALVWIAASAYLGLVWLVTWQALRGQPLFAPDLTTIIALCTGLTLGLLASITVIIHARNTPKAVRA
jgi:hypothetical protein